jgi:hypothetical protein
VLPLYADPGGPGRKSLLETDPDVVYLTQTFDKPLELKVVKEAPVYFYKDGSKSIGTLKVGQMVKVEAITERSYRVRGQGMRDEIVGWVAPWAFSSKDPHFVENLKLLYQRELIVQKLIADKKIAVGMTMDEVGKSQGKPTKTSVRKTAEGQTGRWEFIEYEDVKNYQTEVDRSTGQVYRRLVSITRVEKGKTAVEFENNVVTAIEEAENRQGGNLKIIVPPLVFGW